MAFPSPEDHDILETAWRHNGEMGVTGYLLRTRTQYFQYLEGADDVLDDLVGMIRQDPRHIELQILSDNTLSQRRFGNWGMGYHLVSGENRDELDDSGAEGDAFAARVIAYMEQLAQRQEALSPIHP